MDEITTKEELFAYIKGLDERFTALEENATKEAEPELKEAAKEENPELDEKKEIDEISEFLGF